MSESTATYGLVDVLAARGISRRSFLKFCGTLAVAAGLSSAAAPRVANALETELENAKGGLFPVLWIEGASCTGCTESFAQIETPDVGKVVLELIALNYSDVLCAGAGHSLERAKEETIQKAREDAEAIRHKAEIEANERLNGLAEEREELEREVAALRQTAAEYRRQFEELLHAQQEALEKATGLF